MSQTVEQETTEKTVKKKKTPQPGRDERGRFTKDHKIGENTRFQKENAAACKYKEEYADDLIEFFSQPNTRTEYIETFNGKGDVIKRVPMIIPTEYPTFEAFAAKLGVRTSTLLYWCNISPRFSDCYSRAKELQKAKLLSNTMCGLYNPMFAKFEAINNHGMKDKIETDSNTSFTIELSSEIDEEAN